MTEASPQELPPAGVVALEVRVRGVVQGVGFRPFVYRLATTMGLDGWVLNDAGGVLLHIQGDRRGVEGFVAALDAPPPAAEVQSVTSREIPAAAASGFAIRASPPAGRATTRISPDLPLCDDCLQELLDPKDRRFGYPYINCSHCGPRYTIVLALPYDRAATTMRDWPMCGACQAEYDDPTNRRFHAQPLACSDCGPHYRWQRGDRRLTDDGPALRAAAEDLAAGRIVAIKGLGGYHLACDAQDPGTVRRLRNSKFRREKPFALMAASLEVARQVAELSPSAEASLQSAARPIVLVPARRQLPDIAPDNRDLGIMLPYTPVHHLLYEYGAPRLLVMTSANRSSEPIAFRDDEALERLDGIADSFLIGERPIARRVDDSVVAPEGPGPMTLRRARGLAPGIVARLPATEPILAVGADLKNTVTLVVEGEALASHHLGNLDQHDCLVAFHETIAQLLAIYGIDPEGLTVAHDLHPQYLSTRLARSMPSRKTVAVQHHRAHVASLMAERDALERQVLGIVMDGTGWGDDETIWGGEFLVGSVLEGFERVGHLRAAPLPGGDAAAHFPVQAAAGFLSQVDDLPDLTAPPFDLGERYLDASRLVERGLRTFETTSAGRLFDTAAALLGFHRAVSFEGQAAIWLEHLARGVVARTGSSQLRFRMPWRDNQLDYRPLLSAMIASRLDGESPERISLAFHRALSSGLAEAAVDLATTHGVKTVALSGGVFQNLVLRQEVTRRLEQERLEVWGHHDLPPNDGGVSLGQAALAAAGSR